MGDLEELRGKVDRFKARRELEGFTGVQAKGDAVVSCYKCVSVVCVPVGPAEHRSVAETTHHEHWTAGEKSTSSRLLLLN